MVDNPKISFELIAHKDILQVRADSTFGQAKADVFAASALETILVKLQRENWPEISVAKIADIDSKLYQILFLGRVAELSQHVLQDGIRQKLSSHFEIRLDADQVSLAKHPWESLSDGYGSFLVRDGLVELTRNISFPQPPPQINIDRSCPEKVALPYFSCLRGI